MISKCKIYIDDSNDIKGTIYVMLIYSDNAKIYINNERIVSCERANDTDNIIITINKDNCYSYIEDVLNAVVQYVTEQPKLNYKFIFI